MYDSVLQAGRNRRLSCLHAVVRFGTQACAIRFLKFVSIFVWVASVQGQYRFDHWTADNGLPQNSVRDIVQTRDGYLWLTTFDGLVRFDGVRFTVFNKSNSPGIITNRFVRLYEDVHGDLWASTENGGVTRLHQGRFITYTTEHGLPDNHVTGMGGDGQGNLLLFLRFQLIRWVDGKFLPADDLRLSASRVQLDQAQHLPFYTDRLSKVACFVDGQLRSWIPADFPPGFIIFPPAQDRQGITWFSSNEGLIRTENGRVARDYIRRDGLPGRQTRLVYGRLPLQALSIGDSGSLWLTEVDSLQSHLVAEHPPEGLEIFVAYGDREGNYWLGTRSNGLYRARKQFVTAYAKTQGLFADEVYPIYEDRDGAFWTGTVGNGLFRFKDGVFTNYRVAADQAHNLVTAIHQDRAGRLWVNWGMRFEGGRFVRAISEGALPESWGFVWTIHEDRAGALWFGTEKGVVRYQDDAATYYTTKDGLAGDDTKVIIEDTAGGLWLGSYGGLTHFSGRSPSDKNGRFTTWTEKDGLPGNTVRALYQDSDGALWIGTYDGGLGRFKDGKLTRYTQRDGLFDNGVFQILEDSQGWCWMSCNRGIYRVRKQELNDFAEGKVKAITSIGYGKSDGMLNVECNGGRWPAGVKARDGKLWFPTIGGVVVIDPATITTNAQPPPVVIEGMRIDNQSVAGEMMDSAFRSERSMTRLVESPSDNSQSRRVESSTAIPIRPGQENFEIEYTALSFIKSENLRFKYKLEGLDHDWVEAGTRRTAYYSHVPPGDYTFRIIAANSDGVWNEEGKSLNIRVLPPFYRTWWFLTLSVLSVGILGYVLFRYRVAQLEKINEAKTAYTRQLIESQEQERKRIAVELHDSLGQSLVVIRNRALIGLSTPDDHQRLRAQMEEISDASASALTEVRQIAHNLHPHQLEHLGFTTALAAMIESAADASGTEFTTHIDNVDNKLTKEAEINLYRIVQEGVTNIEKHSAATKANISLTNSEHILTLTIEDNGKGFDPSPENSKSGLGLTGIRERATILNAEHEIHSAQGLGTTIRVTMKLSTDVTH